MPSATLRAGDVVSVTEKSKAQLRIKDSLQLAEKVGFPSWVEVDPKKMTGMFKGAPERSEFGQDINESWWSSFTRSKRRSRSGRRGRLQSVAATDTWISVPLTHKGPACRATFC